MTIKVTVFLLLAVSTVCPSPARGGLLRTPKVYNAVITTDENLTPSRAYPVVQPVVHEAGLTYPFGAFGPFGLYNAFNAYPGFYQPQAQPGQPAGNSVGASVAQQVQGRNNAYYAPRNPEPQFHDAPIETLPGARPLPETNLPLREAPVPEVIPEPNNSIAPKAPEGPRPNYEERPANQNNPLQLNEFGLPPSLIPLSSYNGAAAQHQQPYNLPGYPYNFPVLYDSFGNYNPTQYQSILPPFGYFPQLAQPNPYFGQNIPQHGPLNNAVDPQQATRSGREQDLPEGPTKEDLQSAAPESKEDAPETPETEQDTTEVAAKSEESTTVQSIPDSIKNNANKNKDIPDVPPPPIPSGAKEADQ